MPTTILTTDLKRIVRRRAGTATSRRQVADAVFSALHEARIDPRDVTLDDMKSLVADAVRAAHGRHPDASPC